MGVCLPSMFWADCWPRTRDSVDLFADTRPAAQDDDLQRTINYAHVYREVKHIVEDECFALIETLAHTIATHIGRHFGPEGVRVCVRKPRAARRLVKGDILADFWLKVHF